MIKWKKNIFLFLIVLKNHCTHMKRCLTSLVIEEILNKTTVKGCFTATKMANKKVDNNMYCEDIGKSETLYTEGGNEKGCIHSGKQSRSSSSN